MTLNRGGGPNIPVDVVQRLVGALQAGPILERETEEYEQVLVRLRALFAEAWEYVPSLYLTIRPDGIDFRGLLFSTPVTETLAGLLHRDGLRALTFRAGAEKEEIERLLGVIRRARVLTDDDVDDLVTILWNEDFEFISYELDQALSEPSAITRPEAPDLAAAAEVRGHVHDEVRKPRPKGIVDLEAFDSTLYFLDKIEIENLKAAIRREYEQDLAENVLSMLLDVFELQEDAKTRMEVVATLEELLLYLLSTGDFRSVAFLLREAHVAAGRANAVGAKERRALEDLAAQISRPEALSQLLHALDGAGSNAEGADLVLLFNQLRPEALGTMLKWVGRVQDDDTRSRFRAALDEMAGAHPSQVGRALTSKERAVIMGALDLVARLRLKEVGEEVASLAEHPDIGVRASVVRALAGISTPKSMRAMLAMLGDTDPDVRIAAMQGVSSRRYAGALPVLQKLVLARDLGDKDLSEKRAIFEAYGALGGPGCVDSLASLLIGKGFSRRRSDSDVRACAAMALGKIGGREARMVLNKASSDKDPLVRTAVSGALQGSG
jgi:HEAT repeats